MRARVGDRAIVLGGSMAGLLAARVLSEAYAEVMVIDRDQLHGVTGPRRGTPQGYHAHALLARGQQVLEELFPGLTGELEAADMPMIDMGMMHWYLDGERLASARTGLVVVSTTRPTLEFHVRRRVEGLANVRFMTGFDILERMRDMPSVRELPVVVFTGKELSPDEDARLHTLARSVVVKGVESPERLLDETALFLHRVVADLPQEKQKMLDRLHRSDEALVGKKVLVVDDDMRNIFALSSVLERRGMAVLTAGTGREAISMLESTPDVAIVLMDIMMPEMDGYATMQVIRQNPSFRRLPIVALTAKAMKGDREKCLEAGASEYLAKPVNTEQLLSALRMWLHR